MIIVDRKNTLWDISRLLWTISTYLVFLILGFLVSYYYHVSTTIQSIIDRPITCVSTVSLPVELPQCWV